MELVPRTQRRAWQPFTLSGVAAFAGDSLTRLVQVQFAVGSIAAICAVWTFHHTWGSAWSDAIPRLPATAEIRDGTLQWGGDRAGKLSENRFLSIVVDLDATGELAAGSDVQIELEREELRMRSILGFLPIHYPAGWAVPLDRMEVSAWWGAWDQAVLAGLGVMVLTGLGLAWSLLALPYSIIVRLVALMANRPLTMRGAWALAVAAQFAGTLIASAALVAYGLGRLDLVRLLWIVLLQFPVTWFMLLLAPFRLPSGRVDLPMTPASKNPFAGGRR